MSFINVIDVDLFFLSKLCHSHAFYKFYHMGLSISTRNWQGNFSGKYCVVIILSENNIY